ncbi:MAG: HAD family phosphatase [SAR324 cluster bacterium]|uniref:HAD family phosphatase n=1 Tax=SAR324 cluster bacterium TaxID=2024889 RepID=A0A7X9FRC3_9DELT|nr:HAD family phosphatase [SAR324 cluster bacterium]
MKDFSIKKKLIPPPKAVIFDMDGLLIDSEKCSFEAWKIVAARHGYEMTREIFANVVGTSLEETHAFFKRVFGSDFNAEELRREKDKLFESTFIEKGLPVKAGAMECLELLNKIKVLWAIATTTKRQAGMLRLKHSGLAPLVSTIVYGDEVPHRKPEPDLFLEAARRLNILPTDCLVVEDSETGAMAGINAGMRVILIPDMRPASPDISARVFCVIKDLRELIQLFWGSFE